VLLWAGLFWECVLGWVVAGGETQAAGFFVGLPAGLLKTTDLVAKGSTTGASGASGSASGREPWPSRAKGSNFPMCFEIWVQASPASPFVVHSQGALEQIIN
jgi:hypothetical protein